MDLVKSLLDEDESLLDARDPDGYSPLHRASYEGHIDVVRVRIPETFVWLLLVFICY